MIIMTSTESEIDLDVRPLSGSIGAEIRGLDVRHVDDDTVAAVRRVWLDRKVVFFPSQHLSPDEHLAFARRFRRTNRRSPGHPRTQGPARSVRDRLHRDQCAVRQVRRCGRPVKPQYTVRYHWSAGDVGFWGNRTTQHSVVGDFGDQHRVIQRVTLRGDEPA